MTGSDGRDDVPAPDDDAPVPDDVRRHAPSDLARSRARAAGMDLEEVRRAAPDRYRMLNAEEVVRVAPELVDAAAALVHETWPDRQLFRLPVQGGERLLAFPPLDDEAFARFDDAAAELVARPSFGDAYAFFRTVSDLRGTHRELLLPIAPEAWSGEPALVGPFASQQAAEAWPAGRLPDELMADPIPYRGRWFCDVFRSDEELLFGGGDDEGGGTGEPS